MVPRPLVHLVRRLPRSLSMVSAQSFHHLTYRQISRHRHRIRLPSSVHLTCSSISSSPSSPQRNRPLTLGLSMCLRLKAVKMTSSRASLPISEHMYLNSGQLLPPRSPWSPAHIWPTTCLSTLHPTSSLVPSGALLVFSSLTRAKCTVRPCSAAAPLPACGKARSTARSLPSRT